MTNPENSETVTAPLLFDQNISHRLGRKIAPQFPNAQQVRDLKLENATDLEIWQFAKGNGYTIVTFDADFYNFSQFYGAPPKIIWLRFGNTSTDNLAAILLASLDTITQFINASDLACLQLTQ